MKHTNTCHDTVFYHRNDIQIGHFWVPISAEDFRDTGPIENHVLVIPTLPVRISYRNRANVIADTTRVLFYNRGCEYRRHPLNPRGDLALWIAYDDEELALITGSSPEKPFSRYWTPLPRDAFLAAHILFHELTANPHKDTACMKAEECAWWLLSRCLDTEITEPKGTRRQRRIVSEAEAYLAQNYHRHVTLADISEVTHTTRFHVSRLFHKVTGSRLHQRLIELRLRDAVPKVLNSGSNITNLSASLGFSSSSHFSTTFKSRFGLAPSHLRDPEAVSRILQNTHSMSPPHGTETTTR